MSPAGLGDGELGVPDLRPFVVSVVGVQGDTDLLGTEGLRPDGASFYRLSINGRLVDAARLGTPARFWGREVWCLGRSGDWSVRDSRLGMR